MALHSRPVPGASSTCEPSRARRLSSYALFLLLFVAAIAWVPRARANGGEVARDAAHAPRDVPRDDGVSRSGEEGVLGHFRVGPTLSSGFPNLIGVGATAKLDRYFGFGGEWGMFPAVTVNGPQGSGIDVSARTVEGYLRVHPFGGSLFLGLAMGVRSVHGLLVDPRATGEATVSTVYLAPQVGWLWITDFGLSIGFDAGVQLPLSVSDPDIVASASGGFTVPPAQMAEVRDVAQRIGSAVIPVIHLLRVGYMF